MKIDKIKLTKFRCYESFQMEFSSGINIITGPNAVGKTSLVEAIYSLGLTKSPRVTEDKSLIKDGESLFYVEGEFCSSTMNKYKISLGYDGERKVIKKNQSIIKKTSDYLGTVDVVWFSASDLLLLFGSPQNRRVNFDRIMCQISKVYFGALSNYKKILKERNALLKRLIFENSNQTKVLLESVNESLVAEAIKIIKIRNKTIQKINDILLEQYEKNSSKTELLKIEYQNNVSESTFLKVLEESYNEDLKRGNTGFGPHKDDYIFIINNKNIVFNGSQGQQRNAVLNLKLAEVQLINEVKNEYPILILDDLFSELDENRKNSVINQAPKDIQIIITTTSLSELDENIIKKSNIISLKGDN